MALPAEVVISATEERLGAAEMALPGDVLMPMFQSLPFVSFFNKLRLTRVIQIG